MLSYTWFVFTAELQNKPTSWIIRIYCINYESDLQSKEIIWVTLEAGRALIPSSTAPTISYMLRNLHLKDLSIKKKLSQKSQTRVPAWFMTYQPYWCLCAVEGTKSSRVSMGCAYSMAIHEDFVWQDLPLCSCHGKVVFHLSCNHEFPQGIMTGVMSKACRLFYHTKQPKHSYDNYIICDSRYFLPRTDI